jgi:hypothetical protein
VDARQLIVVYALLTAASFLVVALPGDPSGETPWPLIGVNALLVCTRSVRRFVHGTSRGAVAR